MALSDSHIMARVQDGDREIFGLLVTRYAGRFLRFATSKLGDRQQAEDIVQETFLSAYKAQGTYDPSFAVSTWLWTILLNLCRRQWKRRRSRLVSLWETWPVESPEPVDESVTSPPLQAIQSENAQRLHSLLDQLPEMQADALRLRFFGGLPYDEIATTMDCSVSGAKRRVKTGLERLARLMQQTNSDHETKTGLPTEDER